LIHPVVLLSLSPVSAWINPFFRGQRLQAETKLQARLFLQASPALAAELLVLHRSCGFSVDLDDPALAPAAPASLRGMQQAYQQAAGTLASLQALVLAEAEYPDPLLLLVLSQKMPAASLAQRQQYLQRLGFLLLQQFPNRPDLLLQLISAEAAFHVLKSCPDRLVPAASYYGNTQCSLMHLQELWAKGKYEALFRIYCQYNFHRRNFPLSDFVLRCYTVIGAIPRSEALFRSVYRRYYNELQATTISNMLFTALGLEQLDHSHVAELVADYRRLSPPVTGLGAAAAPIPTAFSVAERPLLAVVSADLRMHPVGRFWLPIARQLSRQFRLVHVALNALDDDPIRQEIQALSHQWWAISPELAGQLPERLQQLNPALLLDLGGHTADNRPGLLNQRFAPVQATYLGFYGPSYGAQCDWWILDQAIARRIEASYPASEPIWALPGSSLCYDPKAHGLPELDQIQYSEPDHPVIGSFNHTRKLTDSCLERFALVMNAMPEAVLQFRSHSFYDAAVRRWILRRLSDAGIAPQQLQSLPYAPSGADGLRDYGRIHLHLDTYPVSGTTTTLDSLAMGIPVLTCPNHLYAGAISAALLENAGFSDWVCEQVNELPQRAVELCRRYRSAAARRQLASQVRASAVCDTKAGPLMFADQLTLMLKAATISAF